MAHTYYTVRIHTGNLRLYDATLAAKVASETSVMSDSWNRVELKDLSEETRDAVLAALPFLAKMRNPDDVMATNADMNRIEMEQAVREAKVKQDGEAGLARLKEWSTTRLLEDTPANAKHIQDWLEANVKGYMAAANIDAAISILGPRGTNVLTFRKAAPAVPAPAKPAEVLVKLSDGSTQLPLDKPVPRNATVEQAKDYLARVRQKDPYIRSGSFGTRF